ncbi:lipid-binding SYLF domain-containing protein [Methylacidimicrobium sp. B4]|uniref:lipid-binding SYLF domain-containing protein n=1 Tax=Methylacidimicrobium sp. B4 TaxID=2796139 RepID=UPI001A8D1F45|nr:lipid-binding SYLF domain-containing protein [Methylacidimicrobium sp. B4]QSR84105.1 lipid-binding SYLF domain-containing protein [Methylacidimicrobium sp. B4]
MKHSTRILALAVAVLGFLGITTSGWAAWDLQDTVNRATKDVRHFKGRSDHTIPRSVLEHAKGIAYLRKQEEGFILGFSSGKGLVMAKTAHGWSGPAAMKSGGMSFGLEVGGETEQLLFILNTAEAVEHFAKGHKFKLGADLAMTAGPTSEQEIKHHKVAPVYVYTRKKGFWTAIALKESSVEPDRGTDKEYYGKAVTTREILERKVLPPAGAKELIRALEAPYRK